MTSETLCFELQHPLLPQLNQRPMGDSKTADVIVESGGAKVPPDSKVPKNSFDKNNKGGGSLQSGGEDRSTRNLLGSFASSSSRCIHAPGKGAKWNMVDCYLIHHHC
ncbi:hypothetical protein L596_001699 [Steinernema carpocapsae]|uniref:Uncharacterized protein n=1 Tax=Steinernema carpocapsae TaxID=34508 RepID=A0A4U8UMA4_STECR|nr:hypothetical protein L596_001699 [Steinernema carpocapsae]